jgi:hypothetical protein
MMWWKQHANQVVPESELSILMILNGPSANDKRLAASCAVTDSGVSVCSGCRWEKER